MIIETRDLKEVYLPPKYNTGNGAPSRGFNPPKKFGTPRTNTPVRMNIFSGNAMRWVSERMLPPHNSRRHFIVKKDVLEELQEIAIKAQVFDLNPMEFSINDLDSILKGVPALIGTGNLSFRVHS